jgi:hypothetical protein
MGRILVINFCIFLNAFRVTFTWLHSGPFICIYCYYNFFSLFMGTDFFPSSRRWKKLTQCTMEVGWWKFLNYEVLFSLCLVHLARGQNFCAHKIYILNVEREHYCSREVMHFWARLVKKTWKNGGAIERYWWSCIYYVTYVQFNSKSRTWSSKK